MAFTHAKVKVPRLTLKNPYVRVKARVPFSVSNPGSPQMQGVPLPVPAIGADGQMQAMVRDSVNAAEILEAAVNYEIQAMGFKQQAKLSILDSLFVYGVLKLGYHTEFTYEPTASAIEEARQAADGSDDPRQGLEWNELIKRESVWVKRVSPWDFRYDPDIKQLDPWLSEARWVAFRSCRLLNDVKKDPIYKNTSGLEATATNKYDAMNSSPKADSTSHANERIPGSRGSTYNPEHGEDLEEQYVVLWEIWDKKDRRVMVMAEGHDKFLRDDEWPFDLDGPPVAFLHFHDVPDNRFPMSDFASWFDFNEAQNMLLSMDMDAAKRRMSKILFEKGAITEDQLDKLEQPLNNQIAEVNSVDRIKPFKADTSGMDTAALENRLVYHAYQSSGFGENQRGGEADAKTATEAKIVEYNVHARLAEEQDRVSDWAEVAIRKVIQLMQQLFTKQRMAPILGRVPEEWVPYTKDEIQGEYDITVELMPHNPQKTELMVKQITDLIALLMKIAPMGVLPGPAPGMGVPVNIAKLVEALLKEMSPIIKPQEILPPVPPIPMPDPSLMMGGSPMGQPNPLAGGPGGGGPPLPGEGNGANGRSDFASQGAGQSMTQAAREGSQLAGASTPSRGR